MVLSSLVLLTSCGINKETIITRFVTEELMECGENVSEDYCKLKTEQYLDLSNGFKSFVEMYNTIGNNTFDISATKPPSITICHHGCTTYMRCESSSMAPTFTCNDMLWAYRPDEKEISVGDIIWYKNTKGEDVLHRVIGIENDKYIMKGDSNWEIDKYKPTYKDIMYKVIKIEYK